MSEPIIIDLVLHCARCGGRHELVKFQPFTIPNYRYTHWAPCPANGEPILFCRENMRQENHEPK